MKKTILFLMILTLVCFLNVGIAHATNNFKALNSTMETIYVKCAGSTTSTSISVDASATFACSGNLSVSDDDETVTVERHNSDCTGSSYYTSVTASTTGWDTLTTSTHCVANDDGSI